jgi:hypothetical protein
MDGLGKWLLVGVIWAVLARAMEDPTPSWRTLAGKSVLPCEEKCHGVFH